MSDAVGALNSACDQEAVPAHRWPSISAGRFPPGQQHPRDLRLRLWGWEKDEQRNTGHLGKKEMLHKCSWQRGEGETTLSHWACSEQYSSRCPSNQSSRKYCCCHTHAAGLGGKPCSTEKHSPEEAMTPLLTTVGRQHSTLFLLGWYDLLVYKTETAYACETYHLQWLHKHLCMWTKSKHQGENPPQKPPPPLRLCGWPPRASSPGAGGAKRGWEESALHSQGGPSPTGRAQCLSAFLNPLVVQG